MSRITRTATATPPAPAAVAVTAGPAHATTDACHYAARSGVLLM